jgi:hypothetical protein
LQKGKKKKKKKKRHMKKGWIQKVFRWTRGNRSLPLHASECDEAVTKLLPGSFGVNFVVLGRIVKLFAACCAQVLLLAAR